MSEQIQVTGVVLSAQPYAEYDKRLILLTKERGMITAFANNVQKNNNRLKAACNPLVFGTFTLYEGRSAYTLAGASIMKYFLELTQRFPDIWYVYYFLELAGYYGRENKPEKDMLNLLFVTCRAVAAGKMDIRLIRCIFELRTFVINGEYPDMFACVNCGSREKLIRYSTARGGLLCEECLDGVKFPKDAGIRMNDSLLYTMRFVVTAPLENLYSFTVTEEVLLGFEEIMRRHVQRYTDKHFKSLDLLESLK